MTPARRATVIARLQLFADADLQYRPMIGRFDRLPLSSLTDDALTEHVERILRGERRRRMVRPADAGLSAMADRLAAHPVPVLEAAD